MGPRHPLVLNIPLVMLICCQGWDHCLAKNQFITHLFSVCHSSVLYSSRLTAVLHSSRGLELQPGHVWDPDSISEMCILLVNFLLSSGLSCESQAMDCRGCAYVPHGNCSISICSLSLLTCHLINIFFLFLPLFLLFNLK